VRRALKVLSEREVTPQLGLLKSTLLQLDSTFSEREYGANSFRDFMEKVAQTGAVTLRHAGRSMLVEPNEDEGVSTVAPSAPADRAPAPAVSAAPPQDETEEAPLASPMTPQDGIRAVQTAFSQSVTPPRWPMYVRQAKQYLRGAIEGFDERRYGFASVVDLLRAAGKEGVLRVERDRQGAVRVFPGANLGGTVPVDAQMAVDAEAAPELVEAPAMAAETVEDPPIVDGETIEPQDSGEAPAGAPKRGARKRKSAAAKPAKSAARPARPRARKTPRAETAAADSDG
jgi:hypothetical protein